MRHALLLLSVGLLAGCAATDRPCDTSLAIVHVTDGPGAGDTVLLQVHGVAEHDSAVLEFTLPDDWPERAALPTADAPPALAPLLTPSLRTRSDIALRPGQAFTPELLPEGAPRTGALLLQHNLRGLKERLAEELAGNSRWPARPHSAEFRAALAERAPIYAWFSSTESPVTTLHLLGVVHDPPRVVHLAQLEFERLPDSDPFWEALGCEWPSAAERAAHERTASLLWLGLFVLILVA